MKRASVTEELAYGTALDRLTGAAKPVEMSPERKVTGQPNTSMIKVSVFLNGEEDAFLETLSSAAKFSGGKKISKTKLVEAMVRAFSTTSLDLRGVKTDEELLKRVIAQLRQ